MTSNDQWISYEDVDSAALKVKFYQINKSTNNIHIFIQAQYAKAEQLGGVFIWSIDNDGMYHYIEFKL